VFAQNLPVLILLRALNGAFAAGIMPIAIAIIGESFDESKRQKAISTMIGIMILGGASATFIGGSLSFFFSWKSVYLIYGLLELVISVFLIFILKRENDACNDLDVIQMYTDVLKNKDVLSCLLLVFMSGITVFGSFSFSGELIRTATHLNLLNIGILLSFFGIGGIAGSNITKYIHFYRITTMCLVAGTTGMVSIFLLSFVSTPAQFAAALFIWGMSFIVIHSNYVSIVQSLIPELRGTVMALLSFCMLAGGTVGTLINKKIIDLYSINHIYIHTAILFGIMAVLASIILNRIKHKKEYSSVKVTFDINHIITPKKEMIMQKTITNIIKQSIGIGILSTLFMDLTAKLLSSFNLIGNIKFNFLGRLSTGWVQGKFIYESAADILPIPYEWYIGMFAHYTIGIILAFFMLFILDKIKPETQIQKISLPIIYGMLTTVFAWFWLAPSVGFGWCGINAPVATKFVQTSLTNHLTFGIGLAISYNIYSMGNIFRTEKRLFTPTA
jgi:predicted MFS family arabinose efflux permease